MQRRPDATDDLDALIAHSKVWRANAYRQGSETVPSRFAALDAALPGSGWPHPAMIEIFAEPYGIGELRLLMPALAQVVQRGLTWIAPPYMPYAPALSQHGLSLEHLLLIHPAADREVPWTIEEVLRSQAGTTVIAWLEQATHVVLRRLQLIVEQQQAWLILFRPLAAQSAKSPAALKIRLEKQHDPLNGNSNGDPCSDLVVHFIKCRGRRPGSVRLPGLAYGALVDRAGG